MRKRVAGHVKLTLIVSPIEKGLENCMERPLSTLPRISLAAKAVATPARPDQNY